MEDWNVVDKTNSTVHHSILPPKKSKMKKIIIISVWSILIIGLIVTLGFIDRKEAVLPLKGLEVTVSQDDQNFFIDKMDVEQIIHERGDTIVNEPASDLNIPALEQALNSHLAIANAEVYTTIDGEMKIDIQQRKPIVRIINKFMDSYYIDNTGKLMPLSDKFTARVLVVNGNIDESYSKYYQKTIAQIEADTNLKKLTWLDEVYDLATFIQADTFWKAQIQQVFIDNSNEIELIPRVGDHRILLGDMTDLKAKFYKLLIFYLKGLNTTGWWKAYSVINLK